LRYKLITGIGQLIKKKIKINSFTKNCERRILLSFFLCQSNPTLVPILSFHPTTINTDGNNQVSNAASAHKGITSVASTTSSSFIGLAQIGNGTHWLKASERGLGDFLPLLSMPNLSR